MDKELFEQINQCKSLTQMTKVIFGLNYYNGRVAKKLEEFLKENGLDAQEIIKNNKIKHCLYCGKQLKPSQHKFCSSACSAIYNNRNRKHKEETKKKISEGLIKYHEERGVLHERDNENNIKRIFEHKCVICGKIYYTKKQNGTHCSKKCMGNDPEIKNKLRAKQNKLIDEGKHHGWYSRNIKSYAECFWEKVLQTSNISYVKECHENGVYFLDFKIEKNGKIIDLEIDGKQHKYKDRVESDKKKDEYLKSLGYIVYRIEWNTINNEEGKLKMKNKIDSFLEFYESI